jgi:Domain of unknown function (DUF5606)
MIDVKNFVAVGGKSGVFKLITVRGNGIIIEDFDTKQREFVALRQHEFSPFETISLYTHDDTKMLGEVMTTMKEQLADNPPPSEKSDSKILRAYMTAILPDHDRERVHTSDIKKLIKWFNFLNSRDLLKEKVEEVKAEEEEVKPVE